MPQGDVSCSGDSGRSLGRSGLVDTPTPAPASSPYPSSGETQVEPFLWAAVWFLKTPWVSLIPNPFIQRPEHWLNVGTQWRAAPGGRLRGGAHA